MKRTRTTLAAIASLALLSGCGLAPEEKLAEAEASFAANDFAGAKVYLVSALKDLPGDAGALALLAKTQIAMGDGEGALAALERITSADRDSVNFTTLTAEAQLLRGQYRLAIDAVGEPKSAEAARIAGLAHLALGNVDDALSVIATGNDLPGDKAGLLSALAKIQLGQGNIEAARKTAKQAVAANPKSIDALLASALTNRASYDLPATLEMYEKAAQLYPQNLAAELGRVATLAEMGRLTAASEGLDRLTKMAPKSLEVIHLKARLAIEEGRWEDARALLQANEPAMRDNPSMRASYATALLRVGQVSQARALLKPLVDDFPGLREPRTLLAEAELAEGNAADALATIRALAERPDARPEELAVAAQAAKAAGDPSANRYAKRETLSTPEWIGGELAKADTALRNQQWRNAMESYEAIHARTTVPNAMVLNNLAYAKSKLGETKDAIRIALEAVELAPDHPSVLDTAGWILVQSGSDRARGTKMLEKAARLDPDNAAIAKRLAAAKRG